tara:strand:- start:364 stop:978 length:615 start_codon:yes stop_codon:yes gene_type:complete
MSEGIIYVLTNPSMPGLVKIGKTTNLKRRMEDLYNSSVPTQFRCIFATKINDYHEKEKKLHLTFGDNRDNPKREFFRISEDAAIASLELLGGEIVTPDSDIFEDNTDKIAFEKVSRIRQAFNFEMVDIPHRSTLNFIRDENITCKVISKNRVEFRGKEHSLSSSALILTNEMGYNWKTICGPENWKYDGEVLNDIRVRLEEGEG